MLSKLYLNETYSKAQTWKHLSDEFPIKNGLEPGNALFSLLFNYALEYASRKVKETEIELDTSASALRWLC